MHSSRKHLSKLTETKMQMITESYHTHDNQSTSGSILQNQTRPVYSSGWACGWHCGSTYRRWSGSGEQRQDPSTGDDDVINHLRNEVDGVVYKYNVLITVHEVHNWFSWMAAQKHKSRREKSKTINSHIRTKYLLLHYCQDTQKEMTTSVNGYIFTYNKEIKKYLFLFTEILMP